LPTPDISYGGLNGVRGIGGVVGMGKPNDSVAEDERAVDVLGPNTEAGQALLVAAIGLALTWVAVGPGEGGPAQRAGRTLQAIALVAAAMVVVGFVVRTYVLLHPDGPLAMGLTHDL
jgi:hypothetical protein